MFTPTNTYLSAHFSLSDALKSPTADHDHIINNPTFGTISVMAMTASKAERVRAKLRNLPMVVNSWYRCEELNTAVGSKPTSQHIVGEAIDWVCPQFGDPVNICTYLLPYLEELEIDQLILEHTWIHMSFSILSGKPRNQVLSLLSNGTYSIGLTDKEGNKL